MPQKSIRKELLKELDEAGIEVALARHKHVLACLDSSGSDSDLSSSAAQSGLSESPLIVTPPSPLSPFLSEIDSDSTGDAESESGYTWACRPWGICWVVIMAARCGYVAVPLCEARLRAASLEEDVTAWGEMGQHSMDSRRVLQVMKTVWDEPVHVHTAPAYRCQPPILHWDVVVAAHGGRVQASRACWLHGIWWAVVVAMHGGRVQASQVDIVTLSSSWLHGVLAARHMLGCCCCSCVWWLCAGKHIRIELTNNIHDMAESSGMRVEVGSEGISLEMNIDDSTNGCSHSPDGSLGFCCCTSSLIVAAQLVFRSIFRRVSSQMGMMGWIIVAMA
ncbi:hypothetical protein BU15DRAFT_68845 [Melanogaster broomeanus]|nr:hypothetical protein BU15DRAFT_68845 [Melanogaster broomeanus]